GRPQQKQPEKPVTINALTRRPRRRVRMICLSSVPFLHWIVPSRTRANPGQNASRGRESARSCEERSAWGIFNGAGSKYLPGSGKVGWIGDPSFRRTDYQSILLSLTQVAI